MKDGIVTQRSSGLVVVEDVAEREKRNAAKRKFGPLEIQNADDHKKVGKLLAELRNLSCMRGGICVDPVSRQVIFARERLWRYFATELLGADWDCEVLC